MIPRISCHGDRGRYTSIVAGGHHVPCPNGLLLGGGAVRAIAILTLSPILPGTSYRFWRMLGRITAQFVWPET